MPTKKPAYQCGSRKARVFHDEKLAHKRGLSLSMVTRELIGEALEIYEDTVLAKIAEKREETLASRKTLSHDEVWK